MREEVRDGAQQESCRLGCVTDPGFKIRHTRILGPVKTASLCVS